MQRGQRESERETEPEMFVDATEASEKDSLCIQGFSYGPLTWTPIHTNYIPYTKQGPIEQTPPESKGPSPLLTIAYHSATIGPYIPP